MKIKINEEKKTVFRSIGTLGFYLYHWGAHGNLNAYTETAKLETTTCTNIYSVPTRILLRNKK